MEIRGLKAITVKKTDLLARIRKNRDAHVVAHEEAMRGYRTALKETLQRAHLRAADGDLFEDERIVELPDYPRSHEADYARVIDALEMAQEENLDLPMDEFARYARDEWSWKSQFAQTVATYSKTRV